MLCSQCVLLIYCLGLKVEMMVTFTQVSMYENFVHQGKTPIFLVRQGKAPPDIP